jgi:hypothetical protein
MKRKINLKKRMQKKISNKKEELRCLTNYKILTSNLLMFLLIKKQFYLITKSVFGSVVADVFQITFRAKCMPMICLFFKNYF